MNRAVFTISLDFELIWGSVHHLGPRSFEEACHIERKFVIDRLIDLFLRYEVPATWCIVGHLFLHNCKQLQGQKHPDIVAPSAYWFRDDPCGDEYTNLNYYAPSLIDRIAACPVLQEIGCHSFSHVLFDQCSSETVRSELARCLALAREMGIELRSFAFPRNQVGHLEVLREFGFTHYRGPGKNERA